MREIELVSSWAGKDGSSTPGGGLLVRITSQMLLDQGRHLDTASLAAFAMRAACAACQLAPGPALGLLAVVDRLLRCFDRGLGLHIY